MQKSRLKCVKILPLMTVLQTVFVQIKKCICSDWTNKSRSSCVRMRQLMSNWGLHTLKILLPKWLLSRYVQTNLISSSISDRLSSSSKSDRLSSSLSSKSHQIITASSPVHVGPINKIWSEVNTNFNAFAENWMRIP